jgi:hypothetical protein
MKFKTTTSVIMALGLCVMAMPQAQAFQLGDGCSLKLTRDGFVALRSGPSVSAQRLHKLKPAFHRIFPETQNNAWVFVTVGGYGDPDEEGVPLKERNVGEGYVRSNLIKWSSCSNAG